jgi:hypothetical protein
MSKPISILAASALALCLGSMAFGDQKMQDQPAHPSTQDQTGAPRTQDSGAAPPELSKQEQEYLVALKKCEGMQDAEKQKCVEHAKQKYSRM